MENIKDDKKKMIIIGVLILVIVSAVIVTIGLLFKNKENKIDDESGYKTNTNENVIKDQQIGDFNITNTSLNYKDGNSVLRVSVTNTSSQELSLQEFKIHVYDSEHNEMVT